MSEVFIVASEEDMISLGKEVGQSLEAGAVVALCGTLGAGKTHFSKGIVAGLSSHEPVSSPTFSLVNEYRSGRLPVFHFDFYRLDSPEELIQIGWDDYLDEAGILIVEWADKFPELLPDHTRFYLLRIEENDTRTITVK